MEDPQGNPVIDLKPYMGMAGHAEFIRSDCSVFAHVHPMGTVPMAALDLAQCGESIGAGALMAVPGMPDPVQHRLPAEVIFPYGFPRPGIYRIFVQVKRASEVQTGVFTVHVQ